MKALNSFAFISFLGIYTLSAQNSQESFEKDFNRAEKIFSQVYQDGKYESLTYSKQGFEEARPLLLELYRQDTANKNIAFKLGVCFLSSRRYRAESIPYFVKAAPAAINDYKGSSYKEKNAPLITYKFLGDAYHLNYQFDKAIAAYDKFIAVMNENNNTDEVLLEESKRKIEMCQTGKLLVANPIKIK